MLNPTAGGGITAETGGISVNFSWILIKLNNYVYMLKLPV